MWPRVIPSDILADRRRSSEIRVFNKLRDELSDEWVVYYSRPWWGLTASGGEIQGEADFIVGHELHGLLFVEVKGGGVSYSPETGMWVSRDRNGIKHNIKDPLLQASTCKFRFLEKLRPMPGWPKKSVRVREAVVLLDTEQPGEEMATLGGHDKKFFCHDAGFRDDFGNWILTRLGGAEHGDSKTGPGLEGLRCLHKLVAEPVNLGISLNSRIDGELESMDTLLTGAQLHAIRLLRINRRSVVLGGAGTGKTVLGGEFAREMAHAKKEVLLTCRSIGLANSLLRKYATDCPHLTVHTIQEIRSQMRIEANFDAVVVDEAQDFSAEEWQAVISALRTGGKLVALTDSNQAIYRLPSDLAGFLNAEELQLHINLRNTQNIAAITEPLYEGIGIETCGPIGEPVEFAKMSAEIAIRVVVEKLNALRNAGLALGNVAVLTPDVETADTIKGSLVQAKIEVSAWTGEKSDGVSVSSIADYKGQESNVVFLVVDRRVSRSRELSYVGVSRARSKLFVVGEYSDSHLDSALSRPSAEIDLQ